ncbi:MAG TPA: hypothetical protein VIA63_01580 [Candidatus Limnocylindria bacterium]
MARVRGMLNPVGTLMVGLLTGFIIASVVGIFIQDSGLFGSNGESPIARAYMLGLLQRDPSSIVGIRPNQSIAQRAAELQGAESSRSQSSIQPISLTYIGGASVGGYGVHIYAVDLRNGQGVDQFFPLALTVYQGKVIRSE